MYTSDGKTHEPYEYIKENFTTINNKCDFSKSIK